MIEGDSYDGGFPISNFKASVLSRYGTSSALMQRRWGRVSSVTSRRRERNRRSARASAYAKALEGKWRAVAGQLCGIGGIPVPCNSVGNRKDAARLIGIRPKIRQECRAAGKWQLSAMRFDGCAGRRRTGAPSDSDAYGISRLDRSTDQVSSSDNSAPRAQTRPSGRGHRQTHHSRHSRTEIGASHVNEDTGWWLFLRLPQRRRRCAPQGRDVIHPRRRRIATMNAMLHGW